MAKQNFPKPSQPSRPSEPRPSERGSQPSREGLSEKRGVGRPPTGPKK